MQHRVSGLAVEQRLPALLRLGLGGDLLGHARAQGGAVLHRTQRSDRSKSHESSAQPGNLPRTPLARRDERALEVAEGRLVAGTDTLLQLREQLAASQQVGRPIPFLPALRHGPDLFTRIRAQHGPQLRRQFQRIAVALVRVLG